MRAPRLLLAAALAVAGLAVASPQQPATAAPAKPKVLLWFGTYGFPHPSIPDGIQAFVNLSQSTGAFDVTPTNNPFDLSMSTLEDYDVLVWLSTTGKPVTMSQQQRDDVIRWSQCGGGNIGFHAALDADYGWAEHAELFGAQFDSHPKGAGSGAAKMLVEDRKDPIMGGWKGVSSFMLDDEYYRWRTAKRVPGISLPRNDKDTRVLLSLDETTVGGDIQAGPLAYEHHQPIAWKKTFRGGGRVVYNNMGHSSETWSVPAFRTFITESVKWVSGKRPDQGCLTGTSDVRTRLTPHTAKAGQVGKACPIPAIKPRAGGFTWETSGAPRRLTTKGDSQALAAGAAGNLQWGAQTWVLDLSAERAATADVTVDLSWLVPLDDYDLSVVTAWGTYAAHNGVGATSEKLVLRNVPTCAVLHVAGDNMVAVGRVPDPSGSGPTARVSVVAHKAARATGPSRSGASGGTAGGSASAGGPSSGGGSLAATGGAEQLALAGLLVLTAGWAGRRLTART